MSVRDWQGRHYKDPLSRDASVRFYRTTPTWFHKWVNRNRERNCEDTFSNQYKLNSRAAIRRHFGEQGFEMVAFDTVEAQPNYEKFSPPRSLLGAPYERIVNGCDCLSCFRVSFTCVLRNMKAGVPIAGDWA